MGPPKPPRLLFQLARDPGARLRLYCGACTWSRTYDAGKIAQRLEEKNLMRPSTLIADVAKQVQWPCPACHRMRWATAPAQRRIDGQFIETPRGSGRSRQ